MASQNEQRSRKLYWIIFVTILIVAFGERIIPPQANNFYFTIDQGNDGVFARELFERGQLLFKGPETGIAGIFAGPGWYYFLSPGYKLSGGHPFGALFMVILFNVGLTAYVMWQIGKKVSLVASLFVGASLQIYWYFYDTSRWAFNPFPLIFLSSWMIFLLVGFLEGKRRNFALALVPIALAFNAEVAGAAVLLLFHFAVGLWAVLKKRITLLYFAFFDIVLPGLVLSPFLVGMVKEVVRSQVIVSASERGIFSGTNFMEMAARFGEIFTRSVFPQSFVVSMVLFGLALYLFVRHPATKNIFIKRFTSLVFFLFTISYLLFSTNKGWREWHTIYLYPLIFISFLLITLSLSKRIAAVLLIIVLSFQFLVFKNRYIQYLGASDDPSILANEIKVLDWVYSKREGGGFNVYTYSPHVYDYNWQYLFWWYGREKYGFVPCEYTIQPGFLKDTYIANSAYYARPQLGCEKFDFLIIEPVGDGGKYDAWYQKATTGTELVEGAMVGRVRVEKRVREQ